MIPGLGRSPGEGKGYHPLQYSGLENSMDCKVHGVTKTRTRLSNFHFQEAQITSHFTGEEAKSREKQRLAYSTQLSSAQLSRSVVSDSLPLHRLSSPWNSAGQNTGVGGSLSFLQGILQTQGSNPDLPHCRRILYQLSHKGSLHIHT